MKLSSRERFLVGALLVTLIWFVALKGFIWPGYAGHRQSEALMESQEAETERMGFYLSHYDELEAQLKEQKESENGEEFFYRDIDDTFMDRNLQNLADQAGVSIHRMSIGEASPVKFADSSETGAYGDKGGENHKESDKSVVTDSIKDTSKDCAMVRARGSSLIQPETGSIMETVITMEVHCPDANSVMTFADGIRAEEKSLLVSYLDMEPVYESGEDGQEVYREMSGIMEVRYYYEEVR